MKKYIEIKNAPGITHLKIELYYDLGGYNCFTGKNEPRAYYLSVTPVERSDRSRARVYRSINKKRMH